MCKGALQFPTEQTMLADPWCWCRQCFGCLWPLVCTFGQQMVAIGLICSVRRQHLVLFEGHCDSSLNRQSPGIVCWSTVQIGCIVWLYLIPISVWTSVLLALCLTSLKEVMCGAPLWERGKIFVSHMCAGRGTSFLHVCNKNFAKSSEVHHTSFRHYLCQ